MHLRQPSVWLRAHRQLNDNFVGFENTRDDCFFPGYLLKKTFLASSAI